ncbi:unnamed protein product [Kluyveromyces dobzhanskii CBS 2104]|uniref:WGS project CCBQ000000000 data, contig 00006 n=1 Tax=Kluyveromyces dobzhanskii CBS 2104 TaxID=1427455 RepID=A0A0A8L7Y2_9SACH|nr:unnamed protein product [Kluyveromyces dobzhanskii CBS 2104]
MSDNEDTFNDSDVDGDELLQDWSLATKFIGNNKSVIPLRGEKDFEPDGTSIQDSLLFKAKKVMFDVLRQPDRGTIVKNQVKAYYDSESHTAIVKSPKGTFTNTIGSPNSNGSLTLQFHEFVYLVERGSVSPIVQIELEHGEEEYLLSLQDVYTLFTSQDELDKFFVYAYLKRMGYIVFPADWKYGKQSSIYDIHTTHNAIIRGGCVHMNRIFNIFTSISFSWLKSWVKTFNSITNFTPTRFASTSAIFQSINNVIPYYIPPKTKEQLLERKSVCNTKSYVSNYQIAFDVWKPNPNFKKSNRYLPDFQIVMHNKNCQNTRFPNLSDFKKIFEQLDHKFSFIDEVDDILEKTTKSNDTRSKTVDKRIDKPTNETNNVHAAKNSKDSYGQSMKRIKLGYRSFLLAVMDCGLVSIIKVSEADFGSENIWYVPPTKQSNKHKAKRPKNNQRPKNR